MMTNISILLRYSKVMFSKLC